MDTPQMHTMFRQYAQQMGMQNVRAILPEQIDLVLNTSQMDMVNQIIKENISTTNDRVITDNSKIGQINALRALYNVSFIDMCPTVAVDLNKDYRTFVFYESTRNIGKLTTNFTPTSNRKKVGKLPSFMFLVDFSLNYKKVARNQGYRDYTDDNFPEFDSKDLETNYFPVRLIDDAYLADSLNDFVLKPRLRSPIAVLYNTPTKDENVQDTNTVLDLYIDKFEKLSTDSYVLPNLLLPYKLRMSYIAKPKEIKYGEDLGGDNTACQLPEYLHVDLVKHAVDLYHVAINGSLMGAQQQDQNARRENLRNNYRNEGNTQQQAQ